MSAPREVVYRVGGPALLLYLTDELGKAAPVRLDGKTLAVFAAVYPGVWPDEPPPRSQIRAAQVGLGAVVEALGDVARGTRPGAAEEEELVRCALRWADRLREVEAEIRQALGSEGGAAQ